MPHLVAPVVPSGRVRQSAQPTLDAGRNLHLVPWDRTHVGAVLDAFADPDIQQWHVRAMTSRAEAQEWVGRWRVAWREETDAAWAVTDATSGSVLGYAAVREMSLMLGWAQITYWVMRHARGAGVSSTAVRRIMRWAFDEVGLHRLEIIHAVGNIGSCRVADNVGFTLEGTLRSAMLHPDGWHDMHLHAALRGSAAGRDGQGWMSA